MPERWGSWVRFPASWRPGDILRLRSVGPPPILDRLAGQTVGEALVWDGSAWVPDDGTYRKVADEDFGSATLLSGNNQVVVSHGLGVVPSVVLVTKRIESDAFVVDGSASVSDFTVERGALTTADIPFYWLVKS